MVQVPKKGDIIGIPCDVAPGPFSDEKLISFDTRDGLVSGFVGVDELREDSGTWFVRGVIVSTESDTATVRVRGEFSNTSGLAIVPMRALAA